VRAYNYSRTPLAQTPLRHAVHRREVASGFGEAGGLFACENFDLEPDLLSVAKAMRGALAPIGAVIASTPIVTSMQENDGTFYSTYGWPRAASARPSRPCAASRRTRARLLAQVT
jgi:hypothetical protein